MMRKMLIGILLGCLGLYASAFAESTATEDKGQKKRPVTVADAIEMTQIGDPSIVIQGGRVVQFSPDRSKFAFVTQKGNLTNDTVEYSIVVLKTAEVFASPRPEVVATLASSSNRPAIRDVQWLPDNETLSFLGEQPGETPQVYKVNVKTRKLKRLTTHSTPIIAYSMSEQGDRFVYIAESSPRPAVSDEARRRGFFVTSQNWDELYTNRPHLDTRHEVYVKTLHMKAAQRVGDVFNLMPTLAHLSLAPNGKFALLNVTRTSPPVVWNEYQYKEDGERGFSVTACNSRDTRRCPQQLYVVDLDRKTIEPLLNAPIVRQRWGYSLAAWTRQSSVLLVNAVLPLDFADQEERNRRLSHAYTAEVTVPERKILTITERQEPYRAFFIESDAAHDRIIAKTGVATVGRPLEFRKQPGGWKITELDASALLPDDRLSVTLDQDMSSPPRLVAHDPNTKRNAVVLDLNPQFAEMTFGRVEVFPWKTRDGHIGEGTLYNPPDYVPGKRYPIVVQTHDERRERFWIDGPYTTAYAAQSLANKGFFVLQTGLVDVYEKASLDELYKFFGTSREGSYYTSLFESAIDLLDQRGLIDRNRIGYSGFSRTAYHVLYGLTHSHYPIAAAVAADGINWGYVDCIFVTAAQGPCEKINGSLPYSANLSHWAEQAPTLRLDDVKAPLLLQSITFPLGEWEIYSGLRWLKKPVELLNFYPEGEHELVRPRQRLLSQGSVVDWYCFWLKGEEDPNPAKAEQYKRWRELRKLQDANRLNGP